MTQTVSIRNKAYFQENNKTKRTPDYSEVRVVKFGGDEENTPVPKYKNRLPNSPRLCISCILRMRHTKYFAILFTSSGNSSN